MVRGTASQHLKISALNSGLAEMHLLFLLLIEIEMEIEMEMV
jgi:hypothetical protein